MKIAFVTDDHETISMHFGRANYYEVFTVEDGQVTRQETLVKTNQQLQSPESLPQAGEHHHDHNAMMEPISGCQVLITRGMGRGAYNALNARGIQPIITDIRTVRDAVDAYIAGTLADHPEKLH